MHGLCLLHASPIHVKTAGLQKDADDARASSFLKIIQNLPLMSSPPAHVLVENVVGFENSVTHSRLMEVLGNARFVTQEFILSPLQFGIPYSRPRYFCLAKKISDNFVQPNYNGQLLCSPGPLLPSVETKSQPLGNSKGTSGSLELPSKVYNGTSPNDCNKGLSTPVQPSRREPIIDPAVQCGTVGDYLESIPAHAIEAGIEQQLRGCSCGIAQELTPGNESGPHVDWEISTGHTLGALEHAVSDSGHGSGVSHEDRWEPYKVPMNVVDRWIDAYDIVTPKSRRCCCFTKSYTRYAKGTGSFLATKVSLTEADSTLEKHIFDLRLEGRSLASLGLRYFTPREVANLHSFPSTFTFPAHIKFKQRYALLGNSLSVAVVSSLLKYLFSTPNLRQPFGGQ